MKAKQLARDDGRLWLLGSEDSGNEHHGRDRVVDESLRAEYLNRALELLRHEKI